MTLLFCTAALFGAAFALIFHRTAVSSLNAAAAAPSVGSVSHAMVVFGVVTPAAILVMLGVLRWLWLPVDAPLPLLDDTAVAGLQIGNICGAAFRTFSAKG